MSDDIWTRFFRNSGLPQDPRQTAVQVREHAEHTYQHPKHAMFWSPRIGKTLGALAGVDAIKPYKTLVTCPLVAASQWKWYADCAELDAFDLSGRSCAFIRNHLKNYRGIVIINDDKLGTLVEDIKDWKPMALIVDESHRHAGVTTARGRSMRRIAWHTDWTRLLTGTPVPNHYGSLHGQMSALSRDAWGTSYEAFARRFLIRDAMFPSRVIGYQNEPELYALIRAWASIVRREDIFGPDSWQSVLREVELPGDAQRMYERLGRQWLLEEPELTTKTILDRMMRLHQLTSGFLPDDSGEYHEVHTAKREAILGDLSEIVESDEKAVIFHQFTPEGNAIFADCVAAFKKTPVLKIDGSVSPGARDRVYETMEKHQGSVIAVIQTQSGGIARSLAKAQHVLFASRGFSFVNEEQARDRVFAPGQPRVVYDYLAAGTIDFAIVEALRRKEDLHHAVRRADLETVIFGPSIRRKRKVA